MMGGKGHVGFVGSIGAGSFVGGVHRQDGGGAVCGSRSRRPRSFSTSKKKTTRRRTTTTCAMKDGLISLALSVAIAVNKRGGQGYARDRVFDVEAASSTLAVDATSVKKQDAQGRKIAMHSFRSERGGQLAMVAQPALTSMKEKVTKLKEDFVGHVHVPVWDTLIILLSTMIIVPLFNRLKTSPILGFLLAGVILGPNGLKIVGDVHGSTLLAEFGVVFFLFEMGLELSTSKLRSLQADVFGLGTGQFIITGFLITMVTILAGLPIETGLVIGGGLALSSSAFVLQLLSEGGELGTRYGRAAFGILLFQDLAIVPMMVLTPLLATAGGGGSAMLVRAVSVAAGKGIIALIVIFALGKLLLEPTFKFVAKSKSSEAFVATILFTVLATSTLTEGMGLSDTLGAFLAGVMLAETKYRHQVEADIKPFRGLLLGLFFITVGFSIDVRLLWANLSTVTSLIGGLLALKAGVITALGVSFGRSAGSSFRTGLLLAQGGEFAFVIFALAQQEKLLPPDLRQLLVLVVGLSMAMTPLLASIGRRLSKKMESGRGLIGARMSDVDTADATNFVIVAGFGRVGQSVCELLDSQLIRYKAFDLSPQRVIEARQRGLPVFFGDACRSEVLRVAGVENAKGVVLTLNDPTATLRAVQGLSRDYPDLQIFVRAADAKQKKLLSLAGATAIIPELFETSLLLGRAVLLAYATPPEEVNTIIEQARKDQGYGTSSFEASMEPEQATSGGNGTARSTESNGSALPQINTGKGMDDDEEGMEAVPGSNFVEPVAKAETASPTVTTTTQRGEEDGEEEEDEVIR